MTTRLKARPYQESALAEVDRAERQGARKLLGVAATGLGKTVIFTMLAQRRSVRTLILAHRDELVNQAVGKVLEVWPDIQPTPNALAALRQIDHPAARGCQPGAGVGIVKGSSNDVHAHVVVASVQTLSRPSRMGKLLTAMGSESTLVDDTEPFGLVIIDEAHHAAADSYRYLIDQLQAGAPHGPLLLGVTATPDRGDGVGLDDLFDRIVFNYDVLWGIRAGYLCDVRGRQLKVQGLDVDDIKTTAGEFQAGDAGRHLELAGAPAAIAKALKRHAKDRKSLVFTPTVETAQHVAAECVALGMPAGWISGETDADERRRILRDFRDGHLTVLSNCAVLTEGYDEPSVGCVVVARPTKSRALYAQMIGRGTRKHPEKDHLLVLDVVGASSQHNLMTIPSLFGFETKATRKRAADGSAGVAELADEHERELVRTGELRAEDVKLFHEVRSGGIAWLPVHSSGAPKKKFVRTMPQPGPQDRDQTEVPSVVLAQRAPGEDAWVCGLQWKSGAQRVLIDRVTLELAQGVGEDAVRKMTRSSSLVETDAAWRQKPPSSRLLAAARKWHIKPDPEWNAGQVSDEINKRAARAAEEKLRRARAKAAEELAGADR